MLASALFIVRVVSVASFVCGMSSMPLTARAAVAGATYEPHGARPSRADIRDTERVIYAFQGGLDAAQPMAALLPAPDGSFFGTTFAGASVGTVYRLAQAGSSFTESIVFAFIPGGGPGGDSPVAPVTFDGGNALYGTTYLGGGDMKEGGVYKLTPGAPYYRESVDIGFPASAGSPVAGLFAAHSGRLFGTDPEGGNDCNGGYVFSIKRGGGYWHVYDFLCGAHDGNYPAASFIEDGGGDLYSTTVGGGTYNQGTVFQLIAKAAGYIETPIYSFAGGSDGALPQAAVVWDGPHRMIGTTEFGGAGPCFKIRAGCGTVFELVRTQTGYVERILHSFQGGSDGAYPVAAVVVDASGAIYGTTKSGGSAGYGTAYKLTPAKGKHEETVLHAFQGGSDGAFPVAPLVLVNGKLFGTTEAGGGYPCDFEGMSGCGTVYSLTL